MELFTPRTLISGRVKAARGREKQAVFAAAAGLLGSEQIALVYTRTQGDVCYLAVPAADLASHPGSATPLAIALPGAAGHLGEGAYVTDLTGGLQAVVVVQGKNLHSFVGTPVMAKRFIMLEGAKETHAAVDQGLVWQFAFDVIEQRQARLHTAITATGLAVAVLCAGAWLWAASQASHQEELRQALNKEQLSAWNNALQTLQAPPYPKALSSLQQAVEQAGKGKGALVQFEYKDGRAAWTLNINHKQVTGGVQ